MKLIICIGAQYLYRLIQSVWLMIIILLSTSLVVFRYIPLQKIDTGLCLRMQVPKTRLRQLFQIEFQCMITFSN